MMAAVYSRRATAIGQQLVAASEFLAGILEGLNDEEWGRPVPSDGRTVGVLAHHLVDSHPMVIEVARSVSAGGTIPWTREWINEWNAQVAKTNAHCRKADTIRDLRKAVANSVESIKLFTDGQLDVTTKHPLLGPEPAPVAELLHETLVRHTFSHTGAIQRALIELPPRVATHSDNRVWAPTNANGKDGGAMVRLVVTGETKSGKSVFVSDREVDPITVAAMPNAAFYRLWGSDDAVKLPAAGGAPAVSTLFPPADGFRFAVLELGPDQLTMPPDFDVKAAMAELNEKLPGAAEAMDFEHPGVHQTDTVDFGVVLSGEVWLELDDGQEKHLRAGDYVVQNGTRHAWHNKSTVPCTLAFALIGAQRRT